MGKIDERQTTKSHRSVNCVHISYGLMYIRHNLISFQLWSLYHLIQKDGTVIFHINMTCGSKRPTSPSVKSLVPDGAGGDVTSRAGNFYTWYQS